MGGTHLRLELHAVHVSFVSRQVVRQQLVRIVTFLVPSLHFSPVLSDSKVVCLEISF